MATTEHSNVIAGITTAADEQQEREVARKLAERYRYAFIDLREQRIDPELLRSNCTTTCCRSPQPIPARCR